MAEHPIKMLWNRVEESVSNHEVALSTDVPLEVAAAIAAVPLYPPPTEEWAAVVNGVRLLYSVRVVKGPQWGTDAQHLTTDELVFSTFITLSGLMDSSLLETEPWNLLASSPRFALENDFVSMLERVMQLTRRDRIDAAATTFLLSEFILPHVTDDEPRVMLLSGAATFRTKIGLYVNSVDNLQTAVNHLHTAINLTAEDDPERQELCWELILPMWHLAQRTKDVADVEQVIEICRHRQEHAAADGLHTLVHAKALKQWTILTGDPVRIDECIELYEQAVPLQSDEDERLDALFDAGEAFLVKFGCTNDLNALKAAAALQQRVVRVKGSSGSGHDTMISKYADTMRIAAKHLDPEFGDEEIRMRRALVDLAELRLEIDTWASAELELASALNDQPEAVPWCALAAFWADQDGSVRREATALLARLAGPPPRRRTAVLRRFFPAATLMSDSYAAVAASDRYDSARDPADLDLAIRLWQHQLAVGPRDAVPAVLERLADAHRHRYIELGKLTDLNAEIAAHRACLHMLPESEHKETLRRRQTESLWRRFQVTGMPPNQTEYGSEGGVHALRECGLVAGLSALRSRDFDQAWMAFDLLEAAKSARSDEQPADERKIRAALYHLLSKDTRRTADLRLAIFLYRELVAEDEVDADVLNGLGTALYEAAAAGVRDGDLDEAVVLLRRAHAMEVDHDELAAAIKFNLGNALMLLYRRNKELAVLDQGIALHREALEALEADSPNVAHMREMLDQGLRLRAHHLGQAETTNVVDDVLFDLKEVQLDAMSALFNGTEARRRLEYQWANSDQDAAVAVAESLFDTISTVMWLLSPSDRIERIGRLQNAASDAAALFLRAGMPEQAVEILEHGRNLQWSQQLRAQHEIAALREYRSDIADELESIFQSHLPGIEISVPRVLNDHSIANRREDAIEEARRVEGFEGFLDALPYEVLREAGDEGPVVIVNLSSLRCDAIVINEDDLTIVELTIDKKTWNAKISDFVATVDSLEFLGTERDNLWTTANDGVRDMVQLLSSDIVAPILARLAVDDRPRVWWCPTGMLTFAPLHMAAGDQVVSSYTQNLTSLLTARKCRHDAPVSLLIASVPKSEGVRTALRAVEAEVNIVSSAITPQLHLHGPAATTADLQHALSEHTWFHFAGHGGTPAITVLDGKHVRLSTASGGLWLHDRPLEPKDIVAHELHHVELVVVSACKSAASDVFRFNESLHPSGALQAAGCQQVVASLWAVSDFVVPDFVEVLYRRLTENGAPDARLGAHAVHDAVGRLRAEYPDDPLLWFSFVHIGI